MNTSLTKSSLPTFKYCETSNSTLLLLKPCSFCPKSKSLNASTTPLPRKPSTGLFVAGAKSQLPRETVSAICCVSSARNASIKEWSFGASTVVTEVMLSSTKSGSRLTSTVRMGVNTSVSRRRAFIEMMIY
jgi:hypothetical protein